MITTPEIICDLFSFLDKDQIERIQLVNQLWNNIVIRHKNILPLRQFVHLSFVSNTMYLCFEMNLYATQEEFLDLGCSYIIKLEGTNLSKIEKNVSPRYSQLTVDEVLTNLNDVVFDRIEIIYCQSEDKLEYLLFIMKLVTMKTGDRFRGKFGCFDGFDSKLVKIFDNYIIVDELVLSHPFRSGLYIREVCANPEIVQLPSTPKVIRLSSLNFKGNDEVLNFTCNSRLNANRLTIHFETLSTNYGNFIRQWFELYRKHQNPISLVGKFDLVSFKVDSALDAVKTFVNSTQLRVKYSLETKEFHRSLYGDTNQYVKRCCVLHETDSYALVIEMAYNTDMSSINASDLNQPPCYKMKMISFCVKLL